MLPHPYFRSLMAARFGANERLARLLWAGLKPAIRSGYQAGINSHLVWCRANDASPWPANLATLVHWGIGRLYGDPLLPKQGRVTGSTLAAYLAALRSVHTDLAMDDTVFDSPLLRRLIQGGINLSQWYASNNNKDTHDLGTRMGLTPSPAHTRQRYRFRGAGSRG